MYCPKCGIEVKEEVNFCPKCGAQVTATRGISQSRTSGLAIASLVLGIMGFGVCSILAIIFGVKARNRIRESNETIGGEGIAIAGIVLGIATLAIFVIWLIIIIGIGVTSP